MRTRTDIRSILIIGTLMLAAAGNAFAFAPGDSDVQKITFANHTAVVFTKTALKPDGNVTYHMHQAGDKPISVEYYDEEKHKITRDGSNDIDCFDLNYDAKTDQLACSLKEGIDAWYTYQYRLTKTGLQLLELHKETNGSDDDETAATTTIIYKRKP